MSLTETSARRTGTRSRSRYSDGVVARAGHGGSSGVVVGGTGVGGRAIGSARRGGGEVEFAGRDPADDLDQQPALDGLDALVQGVLVVAGEHRDALLREDRSGVDAVVDDDDARAGLGDVGGERVAHPVRAGELGQVGRVGVDDARRPRVDERGGQQAHESAQHDEVGLPDGELGAELGAPLIAACRTARHGTRNEGMP